MQPGGSQYGVPPLQYGGGSNTPGGERPQILGILVSDPQRVVEAASPISSRPPVPRPQNFDELGGGFGDEEAMAGEEAERGGAPGNRWPRQETLALLKIRSEMDGAFREATLKGPLWEEVSRKLAELGYHRSSKKCKEKFENVHKYYKRTKEGRAGRQDGRSYRFFTQLEALHTTTAAAAASVLPAPMPSTLPVTMSWASPLTGVPPRIQQPSPISSAPPQPQITVAVPVPEPASVELPPLPPPPTTGPPSPGFRSCTPAAAAGISFSTNTSSDSGSESDEATEERVGAETMEGRKRKSCSSGGSGGGSTRKKMMAFFEGLIKQVMERQEAMNQRFLEAIEKREQDRMIREEAWRRQEMARLTRENELIAQERALAASRDAAIITFLQKISGQTVQLPSLVATDPPPPPPPPPPVVVAAPVTAPRPPPPFATQLDSSPQPIQKKQSPAPPPLPPTQQSAHGHGHYPSLELVRFQDPHESTAIVPAGGGGFDPGVMSSRWPKSEVHALIKLRSSLEARYQEAGPKGPLWEEISSEMVKLGYNRSSKRCKEKWENINKYFKKVKESNKKRPEDSKTCPYYHQLEAIYRKKQLISSTGTATITSAANAAVLCPPVMQEQRPNPNQQQETSNANTLTVIPSPSAPPHYPPPPPPPPQKDAESKSTPTPAGGSSTSNILQTNGELPISFFPESAATNKDEMKSEQHSRMMDDEVDSDDMSEEDDVDDDAEEAKMQYKIEFQRQQNMGNGSSGNSGNGSAKTPTSSAATGSYLAMVQ